uniref:Leiomodin 2 (cardiac) a n=1 Tax=Cyprinus carpio TaxID=7962 RepID=A0A8C1QMK3_CYPCA
MSNFGYHKQLGKYEHIDEDELLASLTNEEIQDLEKVMAEIEPDMNIPTGLRHEDQTAKQPTGTFSREVLLKYWEDETHRLLELHEGFKNVFKFIIKSIVSVSSSYEAGVSNTHLWKATSLWNLASTCSNTNCSNCCNSSEILSIHKSALHHHVTPERPSGNPTDVVKTLENILSNDSSLSEVNLNNIEDITQEVLVIAFVLTKMLKTNCSITNLNVESNFISGKGILALIGSLQYNTTLVELRFHNQRHICGGQVKMEMVKMLRDDTTLLKLRYHFDLPSPRMSATSILTHNQDRQRQMRLKEQDDLERTFPSFSCRSPIIIITDV